MVFLLVIYGACLSIMVGAMWYAIYRVIRFLYRGH
jgi:hypothetical protein